MISRRAGAGYASTAGSNRSSSRYKACKLAKAKAKAKSLLLLLHL